MTKAELIKELEKYPDNMEICTYDACMQKYCGIDRIFTDEIDGKDKIVLD